jgi:hypothetical protein
VLARRLLLLAAVLVLLTAVASAIAPQPEQDTTPQRDPTLPAGTTVEREIPAGPGSDTTVSVRRGDTLELSVSGDVLDSVLIERLDRVKGIAPEAPARFDLLADAAPGVYPIRLVDAGRRIGSIEITN